MPKRIGKDHGEFRDVVSGKSHKELKDRIKSGQIFGTRSKDGKTVGITIPRLDLPGFRFGRAKTGIGRGEGKEGDVIGKDGKDGKGGPKAGQGHSEGIEIAVDLEEVLQFLKDELQLPNLLPKPSDTWEEVKKRYNSLSRTGPNALRHLRKTLRNTLKRQIASGTHEKKMLAGFSEPMTILTPINDDFRYRQYTEHRIPSSNALIFFARDWSGSMDQYKCEIVSDMAWWIDLYIRHFYQRTERVYIGHDTEAEEVGEDKFYKYRMGGGTACSSAFKLISKLLEHRYPPQKYNIYVIYFSDGENWNDDNEVAVKILKEELGPDKVNFIGMTQIQCWNYDYSLNAHVDERIKAGELNPNFLRLAYVGGNKAGDKEAIGGMQWPMGGLEMSPEERSTQIKQAIKDLLGKESVHHAV